MFLSTIESLEGGMLLNNGTTQKASGAEDP